MKPQGYNTAVLEIEKLADAISSFNESIAKHLAKFAGFKKVLGQVRLNLCDLEVSSNAIECAILDMLKDSRLISIFGDHGIVRDGHGIILDMDKWRPLNMNEIENGFNTQPAALNLNQAMTEEDVEKRIQSAEETIQQCSSTIDRLRTEIDQRLATERSIEASIASHTNRGVVIITENTIGDASIALVEGVDPWALYDCPN
jgi:hypothetical protein